MPHYAVDTISAYHDSSSVCASVLALHAYPILKVVDMRHALSLQNLALVLNTVVECLK